MSFDLYVVATGPSADAGDVRAMVQRCESPAHPEGELDPRIVSFYEALQARYPDHPPSADESPWMLTPLDVGVDHVGMCLSYSAHGGDAVDLIVRLAERHGLAVYDPQGDEVAQPWEWA